MTTASPAGPSESTCGSSSSADPLSLGPYARRSLDPHGALDALPVVEFVVVWLHIYRGLSFAAIGAALGLSKSTAYDAWSRASKKLQMSDLMKLDRSAPSI